jgi:hypothetical protein
MRQKWKILGHQREDPTPERKGGKKGGGDQGSGRSPAVKVARV